MQRGNSHKLAIWRRVDLLRENFKKGKAFLSEIEPDNRKAWISNTDSVSNGYGFRLQLILECCLLLKLSEVWIPNGPTSSSRSASL